MDPGVSYVEYYVEWTRVPKNPVRDLDWAHALFVDAASQAHAFCFGVFGPTMGTKFAWCEPSFCTQQAAELFGLCAATRIAVHRGWKHLFLFGDNKASISQLFGLRAPIGLKVQQRLLRRLSNLWACVGIHVWVYREGAIRCKKCIVQVIARPKPWVQMYTVKCIQ